MSSAAFNALPPTCLLGESPRWDDRQRCLYWCDIEEGALHRFTPATQRHEHWRFAQATACCALIDTPAGLPASVLLARRDGLFRFSPLDQACASLAPPPYDPGVQRFNDGCCDARGRFWVGTVFEPRHLPLAQIYRLDGTRLQALAAGYTVCNGLAFSPDNATFYSADTTSHTIFAQDFDLAAGTLGTRRVLAQFARKDEQRPLHEYGGRPDGACIDAQGCYWVAMFEGARVLRLSPQGQILEELPLPVQCPTMTCLGGDDLRTLYITTSRFKRPPQELAEQPLAGRVLSVRVDVPGLPGARFKPDR